MHFVDICPSEGELLELVAELDEKSISLVYVDCARYAQGAVPATQAPAPTGAPVGDATEPRWTRWWDDLLSMGHESRGLAIVLDNADAVFAADRKFMTDFIENFLHGATSWIKREVPCHLCLQMVPCPNVARVLGRSKPVE